MIKKVVFVHTDFRLYWPSRLKRLSDFLAEKDIDLIVIEISGKGSPYSFEKSSVKPQGVNWICLFEGKKMEDIFPRQAVFKVIEMLNEIDPDVIFAGSIAFPSGAAAVNWCNKFKKPLVVFDDARIEDVPRSWYVNWIKKQVYSFVDAMLIPAPSHDSSYKYFGFLSSQLFYGINCIDNEYFAAISGKRQKIFVNAFRIKPYFLVVGRQIPVKNLISLVSVFKKISNKSEMNGLNLILIGDGPDHDQLIDIANDLNNNRIFFFGFKNQDEIRFFYHNAIALVMPSLRETWGLVVNEAMAAGLPILISQNCGCSETLVEDGNNGIIFDPGDEKEIAESLLLFASLNEYDKKKMGTRSFEIIRSWGLERFCQGVWQAIEYSLSKRKKYGSLSGRLIIKCWKGRYKPV